MKRFFTLFLFFLSMSAVSKDIELGGFDLKIDDLWKSVETASGVKIEIPETKDKVEFSLFQLPGGALAQEAVPDDEMDKHYEVGIFIVTDMAPRFDRSSFLHKKSWLAYSEDIVMLVSYKSESEITEKQVSIVESLLNSITSPKL